MKEKALRRLAGVARATLGGIWLYQGIVPKWIAPLPFELEIVRRSGLYLVSPGWTVAAVGALEVGLGIWLLAGRAARLAVAVATGFMLSMQMVALWVEPSLLLGPFGGIVKNAALVALAWIVWELERGRPAPGSDAQ